MWNPFKSNNLFTNTFNLVILLLQNIRIVYVYWAFLVSTSCLVLGSIRVRDALSKRLPFEYSRPVIFANLSRSRNSRNKGRTKISSFTVPSCGRHCCEPCSCASCCQRLFVAVVVMACGRHFFVAVVAVAVIDHHVVIIVVNAIFNRVNSVMFQGMHLAANICLWP